MDRLNLMTFGTIDIVKSHNFFKSLGFHTSKMALQELRSLTMPNQLKK